MNNQRREKIKKLVAKFQDFTSELDEILSDEQDAFDNMPESLQGSERGEKAQEAISNLESAQSSLEELIGYLESASDE